MDPEEFTRQLEENAGLLRRIAQAYCRNAADRDDVLQEIAAQLWRSRERFDGRCKPTTWMHRVALNVAISFHRRERGRRGGAQSLDEHGIDPTAPEQADASEPVERLSRAIAGLGELDRALVLLHLEGADHAEISEVLGVRVGAVATRLGRIKERLRVAIEMRRRSEERETPHAAR